MELAANDEHFSSVEHRSGKKPAPITRSQPGHPLTKSRKEEQDATQQPLPELQILRLLVNAAKRRPPPIQSSPPASETLEEASSGKEQSEDHKILERRHRRRHGNTA
jgi:hypothetical protein